MPASLDPKTRAVLRSADAMTTQLRSIADALTTAVTDAATADQTDYALTPTPVADDDPPVQCWHTEPRTPCDWNICRQPTDAPSEQQTTPDDKLLRALADRAARGRLIGDEPIMLLRGIEDTLAVRDQLAAELDRIRRALDPDDETYIRETVDEQLDLRSKLHYAEAQLRRVRGLRDPIAEALERADYRQDMRRGDLADAIMPVIGAALDGPVCRCRRCGCNPDMGECAHCNACDVPDVPSPTPVPEEHDRA
ncbi:hypothetical protein [Streptomyces sp. MI02-7b]|uniref:hypothetical protein n=1 Tax=Streptomyces sp. MI02-7b TaxID=462941 RepID=UPI0029A30936|nr:hypothetical protein [Streptomyces sp. MI02-7b]MDX3074600.1 hypothetical protein [Streptomyces sp. MI02-7b]